MVTNRWETMPERVLKIRVCRDSNTARGLHIGNRSRCNIGNRQLASSGTNYLLFLPEYRLIHNAPHVPLLRHRKKRSNVLGNRGKISFDEYPPLQRRRAFRTQTAISLQRMNNQLQH